MKRDLDYGPEAIILKIGTQEVRTPAYPSDCDYVRVVENGEEVAYWNMDEWRESPAEVMGAIMGAVKEVADGTRVKLVEQEAAERVIYCGYYMPWIGMCKNPRPCAQHKDEVCITCKEPATRGCPQTGQFVCGFGLCNKKSCEEVHHRNTHGPGRWF